MNKYFKEEWKPLLAVTISGLIYNFGLLAGPWFEGKLAQCLLDILTGLRAFPAMLQLVFWYLAVIALVQIARYIKRFYVRQFANNVNRRMKEILYGNLVTKSRVELEQEGVGNIITKAVSDVDDCSEGMRKFTTEVFDTGIALAAYVGMLLWYDWRLALLCLIFPPISYVIAEKMKYVVHRTEASFKEQSGLLSAATLDRISNALIYRVYGCESQRDQDYEKHLASYEHTAIQANIWVAALPPLYQVISMVSVLFILYFGSRNVLGDGWNIWDIAAFTTFLSCFTRLSVKSSKAAKLFHSVQKAQVSWKRMKPLMREVAEQAKVMAAAPAALDVTNLAFAYPKSSDTSSTPTAFGNPGTFGNSGSSGSSGIVDTTGLCVPVFTELSFHAEPGQIIGITGPVACGKSTLGKTFLCEYPYEGSVLFGGKELSTLSESERTGIVSYLGHDPELLNDTIEHNILMGEKTHILPLLKAVCLETEVAQIGIHTLVGTGGLRLSGGQAQRLALARTLLHKKPVIILDDPFSALDHSTEETVFANLKALAIDNIVLLISHRLYLFPQMDQVIWMNDGRCTVGTHEKLMEEIPMYAELYRDQQSGSERRIGYEH